MLTNNEESATAVVRIRDMNRDVFGNGRPIGETLAGLPFGKAHLHTYRGARNAEVRCAVGHVRYCPDPKAKDAVTHDAKVLVVESRLDGRSIYLYLVCPDAATDSPAEAWAYAARAAQAYCDRWQIETSFMTVKQEFALEKARVRTFRRLTNVFSLCILAFVFMTRHLRASRRFRKIVKALNDNVATLILKTHSLLAGIRELYRERKVRFITGWPRRRCLPNSAQMLLFAEC